MDIERVKITPTMASKWLDAVPDFQRKISENLVARLVMAITRGEWRENGATIVFNAKGELIDGQHRLTAIAQAGRPVWAIVVRNAPSGEETFQTIDDGKSRRLTDFIYSKNVNVTSAVLTEFWTVINGKFPQRSVSAPHADVLKLGKPYIDYIAELTKQVDPARKRIGNHSWLSFLLFYHSRIVPLDKAKMATFFARVGDGLELKASDPAYQLRQRFLNIIKSGEIKKWPGRAMILKAFYAAMDGRPVGQLRFDEEKEQFPELRGYKVGMGLINPIPALQNPDPPAPEDEQ